MAETKKPTSKTKNSAKSNIGSGFNLFRYALTFLFVVLKLQAFGNPTEVTSWPWWKVLLPAYVFEAGVLSLFVLLGAVAVVGLVIYVLWLSFLTIRNTIRRRRPAKKVPVERAGLSHDGYESLLNALRRPTK